MEDVYQDTMLDLLEKDYVLHAPRSPKDLRREYPELAEIPELAALNSGQELLFVWYWAAQDSPLADVPDEKKLSPAIDKSFKNKPQKEARMLEYANMNFPPNIKAAIKRMAVFDPGLRVQMMVSNRHLFQQCQEAILRKPNPLDADEVEAYLKTCALARKTMADIQKDIEKGNFGMSEVKDTTLVNLEGASAAWHKSHN